MTRDKTIARVLALANEEHESKEYKLGRKVGDLTILQSILTDMLRLSTTFESASVWPFFPEDIQQIFATYMKTLDSMYCEPKLIQFINVLNATTQKEIMDITGDPLGKIQ